MTRILCLVLVAVLCSTFGGCFGRSKAVNHGPIATPPAAGGVSKAEEDMIAQKANEQASAKVLAAQAKAIEALAKYTNSAEERTAMLKQAHDLEAQAVAAQARESALKQALVDQQHAQVADHLAVFYVLAVLIGVVAVVLAYKQDWAWAGTMGVTAGACAILPGFVTAVLNHVALVNALVVCTVGGLLLYRERVKVRAEIGLLWTALCHLVTGQNLATAEHEVGQVLLTAWHKVKSAGGFLQMEVEAMYARLFHRATSTTTVTVAAPVPAPGAPAEPTTFAKA